MNGTCVPSSESGCIAVLGFGRLEGFLKLTRKHFDDVLAFGTIAKMRALIIAESWPAFPSDVEQAQWPYMFSAL